MPLGLLLLPLYIYFIHTSESYQPYLHLPNKFKFHLNFTKSQRPLYTSLPFSFFLLYNESKVKHDEYQHTTLTPLNLLTELQ
jgi:hypothetical protein